MMLSETEYKSRFDKLYGFFTTAYLTFSTWQGLQDESYNELFEENPNFWNATLFSLQNTFLASLARIYEKSSFSKKDKVISVYALVPSQKDAKRRSEAMQLLQKHAKIIKAVKALRDNQLFHNNAKHLLDPSKIHKKFPMTNGEIEELIESSGKLLSLLNPETYHEYLYQDFAEGCRQDSRSVVEKIRHFINAPQFPSKTSDRS
ncbi:MAG: hypothetical protein Q7S79_03715 [bacterium]|nr:hypothetical protein [bacterium]